MAGYSQCSSRSSAFPEKLYHGCVQNSTVYPATDPSATPEVAESEVNYFTSKDLSANSMSYDALCAAAECKWTEVRQQLVSMQATRGCLIKTDFKSQPDPFKTKPSPERRAGSNSCHSKLSAIFISSLQSKTCPLCGQNNKSSTKQETTSMSFNVNPTVAETA